MASLTRSQLKTASNSTYDTNGVGGITAAEARTFNNDLIDSLITNDLTSSMVVLSASFATSASSVNGQTLTSLNQFTASQDTKNLTLASYTGSNDTTNTTQNNRLSNLESKSASVDISISNINQFTASNGNTSLNQFTSSADNRLNNLESTSASVNISISNLNSTTASQAISISNLNAATSSYAISSSVAAVDAAQQSQIDSLIAASGSYITSSTPLNSLNAFTASQYVSNSFFATTGSNVFNGNQTITGSFAVYNGGIANRLSIPNNSNAIVFNVDRPIEVTGAGGTSGVGFQFSGTNPRLVFVDTLTGYATNIYNSVNDFYIAQANGKFISFPNIATPSTIIYNKLDVSGSVSITGSLTASLQQGYAWVGNSNGVSVAVATSSFAGGSSTDITALNQFTASQDTKNSTLASVTASLQSQLTNIGSQSGSWVTETESGSFLITASVNLNTITFTKGNNTTFAITVNTGSAATTDITALNSFTASQDTKNSTLATYTASVDQKFSNIGSQSGSWENIPLTSLNAYTQSNDTKWSNLAGQSGSWITESETASFARTNVDNNFTANQTFTNITAVSASFTYIQTTYETSSVIYSSGSNQLGDELTDIQTLSGSVKVQGSLTVNGTPVQTSSVDISSLNAFTQSQDTKNNTLASYTGSNDTKWNNIGAESGSWVNIPLTSLNAYTSSNNTKWSNLESQSGSWLTESETGSFARTNANNIFTEAQVINYVNGTGSLFTKDRIQTELASNKESAYRLKNQFGNIIVEYGQTNSDDSSGYIVVSNSSGSTAVTISKNGVEGKINTNDFTASLQQGYVWVGNASGKTSLVATSSFIDAIPLTSLNSYTASNDTKWNTLGGQTGSYVTYAITASSLVTASVNLNTITFTKGDASTFNITVNTGSATTTDLTSLNAFTASQETKDLTLASVTSSLNSATASLFASASLALVTASFSGNTLTFTKGDASTFGVVIPDNSGSAATTIFEVVYTGENITKGDPLYISGSQGANPRVFIADAADPNKMPVTFVSNETIGVSNTTNAIVLGLIEGIDLTGYTAGQSIYVAEGGGWSASLPSGSNSVTQLLGVVTKGGSGGKGLVLNPGPAQLPGLDTGKMWVGNGNNQPIEITSASFASSASFNSYTSSTDSRLTNIESKTGSYATTGSNTFFGNQTIDGSNKIGFGTTPNDVYINSPFNGVTNVDLNIINYSIAGGVTNMLATNAISLQSNSNKINITGKTGVDVYGETFISGALNVTGSLTASLQQGYVWVGDASGRTALVATSSFAGGVPVGGATTGSNVFTGDQTLIDAAGNTVTLSDVSGSLMLVAKTFTSASAHISASAGNQVNLIFKNNNNTADTIISGSNNIFVNPAPPTAGFKRYVGTSGNIILNAANVPQISGSMQFSPTMNNNYFGGGNTTLTMRGPVSASFFGISSNIVQGTINIGSSAANNAEKLVSGLVMQGNNVVGTLSIVANREFLTSSMQVSNNTINGTVTLTAASSSIISFGNNIVADNNFTFTNNFYSGSVGASGPQANRNFIIGSANTFLMTGFADAGGSVNYVNNVIGGGSNTIFVNATSASTSAQFYNNIVYGNTLIVSASSNNSTTNGSAFFGRYGINDGVRNSTAGTIFSVGTGTSTSARKTGFLIDNGSNTFVEGTFNVSGSSAFNGNVNITGSLLVNGTTISTVGFATTGSNSFNGNQRITGSLTMSGSILFVDRSGNDTNTYLGLNALGMGNAGAQPLAVGNSISVAIGIGAMRFASGSNQNIAIGNNALLITSGSKNFAMGSEAMSANTLGSSNVAIGSSALQNNTTGDSNTAIGDSSAQFASGSQNTFIGQYSGYNVTGSNNVIIGSYRGVAGEKIDNNIILSDGQQNVKAQYSGSAWSFQDGIKFNQGTNKPTDIVSVNGSLTVNNSLVTGGSIILLTTQNGDVAGTMYPAVVMNKGTGAFDIVHDYGGTLQVAYLIINPT